MSRHGSLIRRHAMVLIAVAFSGGCNLERPRFALSEDAAWLPPEPTVFFLQGTHNGDLLMSVSLDGSGPRAVVSRPVREVHLTKDGTRMGLVFSEDDECGIIDLESMMEVAVPGRCDWIDPNPDGSTFALRFGDALGIYDASSRVRREIAEGIADEPRWSADGLLYYCKGSSQCYAHELRKNATTILTASKDQKDFWRNQIGIDRLHFNQFDSASINWLERVSPSGRFRAIADHGSLVIESIADQTRRMLLRNEGGFNADAGIHGFQNPCWTEDERFVLGEVDGEIVAVEAETGRAAAIAHGRHPMVWIPEYAVPSWSNAHLGSYLWVKLSGF